MAGQGMVDGFQLLVDGLAGIQGGTLQGAPSSRDSVKLKWTAERLSLRVLRNAWEALRSSRVPSMMSSITCRQISASREGDAIEQLAANVRQALAHRTGKVELGDEPLQLVGDVGVDLDVKGGIRLGGGQIGDHLRLTALGQQGLAGQQLDLDGLLVELQQPDHLLLVIADTIAIRARQKLLEGFAGIFREALDRLELLGAEFDGGLGQEMDSSSALPCCCSSFSMTADRRRGRRAAGCRRVSA